MSNTMLWATVLLVAVCVVIQDQRLRELERLHPVIEMERERTEA